MLEETPVGRAPRAPVSPRNLDFLEVALSSRPTGEQKFQILRFYLSLKKIPYPERDVRLMIAVLAATRERVRELIRDREFSSWYKLEHLFTDI